jgi:histidinol-phosphate aminotransferase
MSHDTVESSGLEQPRLSRRRALLGAAALFASAPFAGADAEKRGHVANPNPSPSSGGLIRIDGNENPYGPSPKAREAILASVSRAPRYADSEVDALAAQLAATHGLPAQQVIIGTGSGELLKIAAHMAASPGPGGELIAAVPTYEELPAFGARLGLTVKGVPVDAHHRHDLARMHAAIGPQTRLVYLCNPNNPTGTVVARAELEDFIKAVPAQTLVVVDEAYIHLVDDPKAGSVDHLVQELPNVLVMRTFSKIHGLAGLRVGYALAHEKTAPTVAAWGLTYPNSTGIAAATASLHDTVFLTQTRRALISDRNRIHAAIDARGLPRADSQGNFVFFDTGGPLKRFQNRMLAKGIKVGRHFDGYDTWARVSIGLKHETDAFLAALPGALGA